MPATLVQRIQLQGAKEIVDELRQMGAEGEKAIRQIDAASKAISARGGILGAFSAQVAKVRGVFGQLGDGFRSVTKAGEDFGGSIERSAKRIAILTAAVGGAAAGLVALAKSSADNAQEILDTAESFGLTTDQVQRFTDAAKLSGGGLQDVTGILSKFAVGLNKAGDAAGGAANPLGDFADNVITVGGAASQFVGANVQVVRGLEETAKAATAAGTSLLDGLTGATLGDRLLEFAHRLDAIPTELGKIQALTAAGFKTDSLAKTLDFFRGLEESSKALLPPLSQATLQLGDRLSGAINATGINLGRLKDGLVDTFVAPALTEGLGKLNAFLVANRTNIAAFAADIRDKVVPVVADLFNAFTGNDAAVQDKGILDLRDAVVALGTAAKTAITGILIPALNLVRSTAAGVAAVFNGLFGTKVSGDALLIAASLATLTGAFGILTSSIGLVSAAVQAGIGIVGALVVAFGALPVAIVAAIGAAVAAIVVFWPQITEGATAAVDFIAAAFSGLKDLLSTLWSQLVAQGGATWDRLASGIKEAFSGAIDFVENLFDGLVGFVEGIAGRIASIVSSIISSINSALSAQANAAPQSSGPSGFASGGFVRGPGSATSDSILARLSNGEFVLQAAAVKRYGLDFVRAINGMKLPRDAFRGFSLGGLVEGVDRSLAIPRFAGGGLAALGPAGPARQHVVNLSIGGESFPGLLAPEDVASRLVTFASRKSARRAGARPSWY